jgi:hypothetical protein
VQTLKSKIGAKPVIFAIRAFLAVLQGLSVAARDTIKWNKRRRSARLRAPHECMWRQHRAICCNGE